MAFTRQDGKGGFGRGGQPGARKKSRSVRRGRSADGCEKADSGSGGRAYRKEVPATCREMRTCHEPTSRGRKQTDRGGVAPSLPGRTAFFLIHMGGTYKIRLFRSTGCRHFLESVGNSLPHSPPNVVLGSRMAFFAPDCRPAWEAAGLFMKGLLHLPLGPQSAAQAARQAQGAERDVRKVFGETEARGVERFGPRQRQNDVRRAAAGNTVFLQGGP